MSLPTPEIPSTSPTPSFSAGSSTPASGPNTALRSSLIFGVVGVLVFAAVFVTAMLLGPVRGYTVQAMILLLASLVGAAISLSAVILAVVALTRSTKLGGRGPGIALLLGNGIFLVLNGLLFLVAVVGSTAIGGALPPS